MPPPSGPAGCARQQHLVSGQIFFEQVCVQDAIHHGVSAVDNFIGARNQRRGALGRDAWREGAGPKLGIERMQGAELDGIALAGTLQIFGQDFSEAAAHPFRDEIGGEILKA